jgi:negative regulator of sigma E activity
MTLPRRTYPGKSVRYQLDDETYLLMRGYLLRHRGMTIDQFSQLAVKVLLAAEQAHSTPIAPEDDPSMAIVNEILHEQATKMKMK